MENTLNISENNPQRDRLVTVIKALGISISTFEKNLGWSNSYVRKCPKTLGVVKIKQINSAYPAVNLAYLTSGEGEPINKELQKNLKQPTIPNNLTRVIRFKNIISYLKAKNIVTNQADLGRKVGYDNASHFSQIVNSKDNYKLPEGLIEKINKILPTEVNRDYIVNGGDMLVKEVILPTKIPTVTDKETEENIKASDLMDFVKKEANAKSAQMDKIIEQQGKLITEIANSGKRIDILLDLLKNGGR